MQYNTGQNTAEIHDKYVTNSLGIHVIQNTCEIHVEYTRNTLTIPQNKGGGPQGGGIEASVTQMTSSEGTGEQKKKRREARRDTACGGAQRAGLS
jgi:hypothetical protein